jgi:translocation and assembly module TamA
MVIENSCSTTRRSSILFQTSLWNNARVRGANMQAGWYGVTACVLLVITLPYPGFPDDLTVPYRTAILGTSNKQLRAALEEQSMTMRQQKTPPATMGQLRRRVENDVPHLEAVLQSLGYLQGEIDTHIDTNQLPHHVNFKVAQGARYALGIISVEYANTDELERQPGKIRHRIAQGQPAEAQPVVDEETAILEELMMQGFPFPSIVERSVDINHEHHGANITFHVDPGPFARFGELAVSGIEKVNARYVRRRAAWKEGDPYDIRMLRNFERDLLTAGLFATAVARPGESLDEKGRIAIHVEVFERKSRTIRLGGNYRSDIGIGGKTSWEHRNLFGGGESLEITLSGSEIEWGQRTVFVRPDILHRDLFLVVDLETVEERPDAYTSRRAQGSTGLEWRFTRQSRLSGALGYKYSEVSQLGMGDNYSLVLIPAFVDWDTRDDRLDPLRGWRAILGGAPYVDLLSNLAFFKVRSEGSYLFLISQKARFVAAARLGLGSIDGARREDIPADERLYAGGGGSVRGYEYQSIGDQIDGTPLGGNSLIETSLELRTRPGDTLGYVVFVDGGAVGETSIPLEGEKMRWALGCGLRYSLGFAPLRVDVAFPIDKRDTDDNVQFYISIGQAF